jgi:hypothetical protein
MKIPSANEKTTIKVVLSKKLKLLEAAIGIEPMNKAFAELCLTTWLRRRRKG